MSLVLEFAIQDLNQIVVAISDEDISIDRYCELSRMFKPQIQTYSLPYPSEDIEK